VASALSAVDTLVCALAVWFLTLPLLAWLAG
jgi:hypothetical protein